MRCSPIFERTNLYGFAIQSLEILLFGHCHSDSRQYSEASSLQLHQPTALASLLLSRRARGKAIDRLVIDYSHIQRLSSTTGNKADKKEAASKLQGQLVRLCEHLLEVKSSTSSISFLARRLKRPLSTTLEGIHSIEVAELGLRLDNAAKPATNPKTYADWTPITDRSVANAIGENEAGARCAFIGHEDDESEGQP